MRIDTCEFKNPYVEMYDPSGRRIQVKLDDEGVVIDIYDGDECVDSTYKFYQEMIDGED